MRRSTRSRFAAGLVAAIALTSSIAAADGYLDAIGDDDRPLRQGLTFEIGVGGSLTYVARDRADSVTGLGPAALSLGAGMFIAPKLAVLLREAGTTYFDKTSAGAMKQVVNELYGVYLQYWANDTISLSSGLGLALILDNPVFATETKLQVGFGGSSGVGISLLTAKHHVLKACWEIFNSKVSDAFVFGSVVSVEWQSF